MAREVGSPNNDKPRPDLGDTDTSRTIIVRVAASTHRALRIRVAEEDTSIQGWLEAIIHRELGLEGGSASAKGKSSKRTP